MVDYLGLYSKCEVTTVPADLAELAAICKVSLANQSVYQGVALKVGVPWPIIAAIHFRESSQNFNCHLHNGDPLTARTVHVPAGRPVAGQPPFTWAESACDALTGLWRPMAWSIAGSLEFCEHYNGMGYQNRGEMSPYIWDFTDQYRGGLFIGDGIYSATAKEHRPGVVSILKSLALKGVSLDFSNMVSPKSLLH